MSFPSHSFGVEQDGDTDSNQDGCAGEDHGDGMRVVEVLFSGDHGENDGEGGAESHDSEHHGVGRPPGTRIASGAFGGSVHIH